MHLIHGSHWDLLRRGSHWTDSRSGGKPRAIGKAKRGPFSAKGKLSAAGEAQGLQPTVKISIKMTDQ